MNKRKAFKGQRLLEPFRDAELFGKAKMLRNRPMRYTLLIRKALDSIGLCWYDWVTAWNVHHKPGPAVAGYQLIDFIVKDRKKKILFAILPDNPNTRVKKVDREKRQAKIKLLDDRHIPYLEVPINYTSQEYEVTITMFIRRIYRARLMKELGY